MKIIISVLIAFIYVMPAAAFDVKVFGLLRFGVGEEKRVDAPEACTQAIASSKPKPKPQSKPKPKPAMAASRSTETIKLVAKDKDRTIKPRPAKPEYLVKAEKLVKVKRSYKRDWFTLSTNSIGAAGITYGARKSNWFIGSGGALILLYSAISERNTNSPLDQIASVGSGIGLGYLPKISSSKEDNKTSNPVPAPLPPPPAP